MGIRVHTVMGYGLVDVKSEDRLIVDDRFNPEGAVLCEWDEYEEKYSFGVYRQHILDIVQQHEDKTGNDSFKYFDVHLTHAAIISEQPWLTKNTFDSIIHYDTEGGLEQVICFVPPGSVKTWSRYDDTIDYYMHNMLRDTNCIDQSNVTDGMNWCRLMDVPFYPYSGYIDKSTGEPATIATQTQPKKKISIENIIYHFRNTEENIRLEKLKSEPNNDLIQQLEQTNQILLESIGCHSHWTEKFTPTIPSDLIAYLKFANIFKEDSSIWQLRPMIYTYWN